MDSVDDLIIKWNLRFRYDRLWRKKYNISFGSKEHLEASQIDIFFDIREDQLFAKLQEEYQEQLQNQEEYKKTGKFLKERKITVAKEEELIKKLKLSLNIKK